MRKLRVTTHQFENPNYDRLPVACGDFRVDYVACFVLLFAKKSIPRILHLSLIASCRCGAKFQAPPNLAGKQVACPTCGQALVVPAATARPAPAAAQAAGTIAVACRCGKRFAAPPHLAGKQVQCPGCKQPLMVPAAAMQPASPGTPVTATGPITVSCRCGKRFSAPANLAGKQVACPSCRNPILVQAGASSAPSAADDDGFWDEIEPNKKTPQEIYEEEQGGPEPFSPTQATSFAIDRISRGVSPGVVYDELREKGVGPEESERIVEDLHEGHKTKIKGKKRQARDAASAPTFASQKLTIPQILFSFEGRIPRRVYWAVSFAFSGVGVVLNVVLTVLLAVFGEDPPIVGLVILGIVLILLYIPMLWISFAVQVKRWHDINKPGVWLLIVFVPMIGPIWAFIELGCMRGTVGPNDYGPDPT